jgi:hypothetical protein
MLPTFPEIVRYRHEQNVGYLKKRIGQMSPIQQEIRKHIQHEGRSARIERQDKSADSTEFNEASGEMSVRRMPMREFGLQQVSEAYDDIARQFARQFDVMMMSTLDAVTSKRGNVVDAGGRPMNADLVLTTLETMELSFAPDGTWEPPTLWGGSKATAAYAMIMSDPDFQERLAKLLDRKLNEFRRREAGRVLVG